ncbi:hypothetical protein [uncultured Pontibacter sp.]|uniref:hypothetical protein n=1 Tax=uncultured Pontibacter sp. TaxID=453356 RepID=UPI00260EF890|nr:hypothetical protein [uncultured Pontibacter sp.]
MNLNVICIVPYAVKNILLSFTFLFAFFSLQHGAAVELQAAATQQVATQGELREFDRLQAPYMAVLQAEDHAGTWQFRPTQSSKQASYSSPALAAKLQEFRLQLLIAHYLQRIRHISPGLAVSDIIFPFHYFW